MSHRLSRRDVLKGLAAVAVGGAAGAAAHGFLYGRHHIEVTRTVLRVAGLPESIAGLRIGFMTDLHRSSTVSHELIAAAARLLMAEQPDLIVLGGDYVTWGGDYRASGDRYFVEPAADAVSLLSAPHGVYGVLGNHDDDRDIPAAMAAKGIEILKDARTRITIRGEALDLIGIRYWTTRLRDIAALVRGATKASMFLAHNPSPPQGSRRPVTAADVERTHPRRANRSPRTRSDRRQKFPDNRRRRLSGQHDRVCQPRRRDHVRPDPRELPT